MEIRLYQKAVIFGLLVSYWNYELDTTLLCKPRKTYLMQPLCATRIIINFTSVVLLSFVSNISHARVTIFKNKVYADDTAFKRITSIYKIFKSRFTAWLQCQQATQKQRFCRTLSIKRWTMRKDITNIEVTSVTRALSWIMYTWFCKKNNRYIAHKLNIKLNKHRRQWFDLSTDGSRLPQARPCF